MTDVTVEIPEETPDETVVVNEGDTTVVVDTPAEETPDNSQGFEAGVTIGALVERVAALENRVFSAELQAESAQQTAEVALDETLRAEETAEDVGEAVEVVAEAVVNDDPEELEETAEVVEDHSDTILPTKKHLVHRSWREILGR